MLIKEVNYLNAISNAAIPVPDPPIPQSSKAIFPPRLNLNTVQWHWLDQ